MATNNDMMVQVYAGSFTDASEVQFLLENEGIESFIENGLMGTIAPWQVSAGGVAPVKVMISDKDMGRALELLKDFQDR
ncbi:hypothetical protein ACVW0P_003686 [Mucilaginibacter sp. UYNi724]